LDLDEMREHYQTLNISFTDILQVLLIIIACDVFGKIWKGCSYLIIILAAVFYFMNR